MNYRAAHRYDRVVDRHQAAASQLDLALPTVRRIEVDTGNFELCTVILFFMLMQEACDFLVSFEVPQIVEDAFSYLLKEIFVDRNSWRSEYDRGVALSGAVTGWLEFLIFSIYTDCTKFVVEYIHRNVTRAVNRPGRRLLTPSVHDATYSLPLSWDADENHLFVRIGGYLCRQAGMMNLLDGEDFDAVAERNFARSFIQVLFDSPVSWISRIFIYFMHSNLLAAHSHGPPFPAGYPIAFFKAFQRIAYLLGQQTTFGSIEASLFVVLRHPLSIQEFLCFVEKKWIRYSDQRLRTFRDTPNRIRLISNRPIGISRKDVVLSHFLRGNNIYNHPDPTDDSGADASA
jgi:hypothetical protein